ncbi:MAG: MFS transporter [Patescibacteria group bacterium]
MYALKRRLLPLYASSLATGFMFHYSIIFPYMNSLGFSTSQLVTYAIVANAAVILIEVPAGLLADRWSRKGVLLLSLVFMAVGCMLFGSAESYFSFILATVFAGLYFGMSSGVQEAMVYDVLVENHDRKNYEKLLGYLHSTHTVGLVLSSIAGAVLASVFNFRLPFYLSLVSCIVGFVVLAFFKEPRLHREVESAHLIKHITSLFNLLTKHPETRLLVLTNVLIGITFCFILEVDPLWPIALGLATIWYGPLNALLLSSQGLAGLITGVASVRLWLIRLLGLGLLLAALGLTIQNIYLVVISQFVLATCSTTLMILLSGRIQDTLPASQRSGSESAISTISRLSFIALLPLFSIVAQKQSVFIAAWILVVIALFAVVGLGRSFRHDNIRFERSI